MTTRQIRAAALLVALASACGSPATMEVDAGPGPMCSASSIAFCGPGQTVEDGGVFVRVPACGTDVEVTCDPSDGRMIIRTMQPTPLCADDSVSCGDAGAALCVTILCDGTPQSPQR